MTLVGLVPSYDYNINPMGIIVSNLKSILNILDGVS